MIKSSIWIYKNHHNWSMLMLCCSGIETITLLHSTCVICRHRVKTLLSCSVEEGNRQGMYMHTIPWSRLPKSCYSCRSFGHSFVEFQRSLLRSKGPNPVPIVRLIQFIVSYLISLSPFIIVVTTLRCAK